MAQSANKLTHMNTPEQGKQQLTGSDYPIANVNRARTQSSLPLWNIQKQIIHFSGFFTTLFISELRVLPLRIEQPKVRLCKNAQNLETFCFFPGGLNGDPVCTILVAWAVFVVHSSFFLMDTNWYSNLRERILRSSVGISRHPST